MKTQCRLEFDIAMLNREVLLWGVRMPQPVIEVSALYCDFMNRQLPARGRGGTLRSVTMLRSWRCRCARRTMIGDTVMAGGRPELRRR